MYVSPSPPCFFFKECKRFLNILSWLTAFAKQNVSIKNPGSWHFFKNGKIWKPKSLREPFGSPAFSSRRTPWGKAGASPVYCWICPVHFTHLYSLPDPCEHLGLHAFFQTQMNCFPLFYSQQFSQHSIKINYKPRSSLFFRNEKKFLILLSQLICNHWVNYCQA